MAFARKWLSWFRHDTRPLQVCQRLDQTPLKQHFPFSQQKCSDKRAFDRHFPGFISKTALVWAVFCTTSGSKTHSTASSLPSRVQHQSKLTHNGNCCLPDDFAVGNIQRGDGFVFQADEDALPIAGVGALPDSLGRRERPPGRARFEVEGEKRTARGGKDDRPADNQRRVIDRAVGLGRPREGEVVVQRGFAGLRGTAEDGQQEEDQEKEAKGFHEMPQAVECRRLILPPAKTLKVFKNL